MTSIDIVLAGRVAQEILLGQPTDGARSDLSQATGIAEHYINSGFSEYGFGIPSEGVDRAEIQQIIKKILADRYKRVKQQLSKEKGVLQELANLLVKKKIVFQDELKELRKGNSKGRRNNHEIS